MKRFVCYTLEGLLRQGQHEVWVVLGTFPSAEQADSAGRAASAKQAIARTRVMPYYRTIELPVTRDNAAANLRPHLAASRLADESVTVA
jgi:hypothetical protein